MLEGLSRFLVQHERCGAGFDVAHPAGLGSGRVSITCRGCGARHEYATATIEVERELRIEPASQPEPASHPEQEGPARKIPPRPAPYPDSEQRPLEAEASEAEPGAEPARRGKSAEEILRAHAAKAEAAGRRRGGRPESAVPRRRPAAAGGVGRFLRSPGVTVALLLAAAAALGFGVVRLINDDGGPDGGSQSLTAPAPAAAPEPPPAAPEPPAGAPTPPASPVPGAPQPAITTVRTERFTLEVPRSWSSQTVDGGLLAAAARRWPGQRADLL